MTTRPSSTLLAFSSTLLLAALGGGAHAAQIPASADATVSSKKAGKNAGDASTLVVDAKSNAMLQFDLTDLPDGTQSDQVAKATLRLWVRSKPKPGSLAVGLVTAGWSEGLVTASNAPAFTPTGVTAVLPNEGEILTLDVTDLVRAWVGGAPNNGILLTPEIPGNALKVVFDSRENTQTARAPTLDIEVDRISMFRTFTIDIPAAAWDGGFHYGDNNVYRGFELTPAMTGGIDLATFHAQGGLIQVYAKSTGKNGYSETKALPYVYSSGNSPFIGVRIEYLATRRTVVISKTTVGWDAANLTAAELPSNVQIRVTMIGFPQ